MIEHTILAMPDPAEKEFSQNLSGDEPLPVLAAVPQLPQPEELAAPKAVLDLALDLVLNEIVLQARLTTNATGAVFGMGQYGELICRATTGATASEVAACLKEKSGIAATCFMTGAVRRVDDLGSDPCADAVAYRRNGVRSILVVPVQGEKGPALGILEIFSPRPNAFCERDVMTLQALARRIATNVELVQQTYGQETHSARPSARVTAWPGKLPAPSPTEIRNARRKFKAPKWITTAMAQMAKLKSVDWISVLAKSSIALALIGGTVVARSCWVRDGGIQAIRGPLSQLYASRSAKSMAAASALSNKLPFRMKVPAVDLSTWPPKGASHPTANAAITIQRQPVVTSAISHARSDSSPVNDAGAVQPAMSGDSVSLENHRKIRGGQESQPASKDPAPTALPNKISADGKSGPEVLTTQAAMERLVQRIEPEYPNAARQQRISGAVVLDVIVNETGAVDGLSMVSGESQLMSAAAQAVRQWKFQPLIKGGQPVKFESRISIDFTLVSEGH